MLEHVWTKHVTSPGITCQDCGKQVPTRNALKVHRSRPLNYRIEVEQVVKDTSGSALILIFVLLVEQV